MDIILSLTMGSEPKNSRDTKSLANRVQHTLTVIHRIYTLINGRDIYHNLPYHTFEFISFPISDKSNSFNLKKKKCAHTCIYT